MEKVYLDFTHQLMYSKRDFDQNKKGNVKEKSHLQIFKQRTKSQKKSALLTIKTRGNRETRKDLSAFLSAFDTASHALNGLVQPRPCEG